MNTVSLGKGQIPPFRLKPAFKDYIWGGTKLKTQYAKKSPLPIIAESWELSAHEDGSAEIETGLFSGRSFREFIREHPEACGSRRSGDRFPILIKLIDSKTSLSVQVHPDDEYAKRAEGEPGKTEMWVILQHDEGAFLYFGFKGEISRREFEERIRSGTLTEVLNKVPVHCGDVFFIPAGTIHAIGAGITLAEIQQNSNSTYRVFDFGRVGADGKARPLHIEKALDVTSLTPASFIPPGRGILRDEPGLLLERLASCPEFVTERLTLSGDCKKRLTPESFLAVLCVEGEADIAARGESLRLSKGGCVFAPAGDYSVDFDGEGQFLLAGI